MEICSVEAESCLWDRQTDTHTDVTNLIVEIRKFCERS